MNHMKSNYNNRWYSFIVMFSFLLLIGCSDPKISDKELSSESVVINETAIKESQANVVVETIEPEVIVPEPEESTNTQVSNPENSITIEDIQPLFNIELTSITHKKTNSFQNFKDGTLELETSSGVFFWYNYLTGDTQKLGRELGRFNGFKEVIEPLIRDNQYFSGYEGEPYVLYSESDGFSYYGTYSDIDTTSKKMLLNENQYVDLYNCIQDKSELEVIFSHVAEEELAIVDYNENYIAYKKVTSDDLFIYDRHSNDITTISGTTSFFHLSDQTIIYQKAFDKHGVYSYEHGEEKQLLDFMVLDAIIFENELYYIDINLQLYHKNGIELEQLSDSFVMEYIFDEDYVLVTLNDDMLHVLYELKEKSLAFIRPLSLGTLAYFDWCFSDGEDFYYNGSYEIPFTYSTSLDIGQTNGQIIYENDDIIVSSFTHVSYEFSDSTTLIYYKSDNNYENIGTNTYISNWKLEDELLYLISPGEWGASHKVYRLNLIDYEIKLVKEIDNSDNNGRLMDYNIQHDIAVFNYSDNLITSLDLTTIYVVNKGRSTNLIHIGNTDCYYLVNNKELYNFNYITHDITYIDHVELKYSSSHRPNKSDTHFIYQSLENKVNMLNFKTKQVNTIANNCQEYYTRKVGSHDYYMSTGYYLYTVVDGKSIQISSQPISNANDDNHRDIIAEVTGYIYYINKLENKLYRYNTATMLTENVDIFWIEGELLSLRMETIDDQPVVYVYAGPTNIGNKYIKYLIDDSTITNQGDMSTLIKTLALKSKADYTILEGINDNWIIGTKDEVNETTNFDYIIYNSQTKQQLDLPGFDQLVEKIAFENDSVLFYFNEKSVHSNFRYFPYTEYFDIQTGKLIKRDNYLQLSGMSRRFDIGSDTPVTTLKDLQTTTNGFIATFAPLDNLVTGGNMNCPTIKIDGFSDRFMMLIIDGLKYEDKQFIILEDLSFIKNVKVTSYQGKVYIEIDLKDIDAFTCDFIVDDTGFVSLDFIFK